MRTSDLAAFHQILGQHGYRVTKARDATFTLLQHPQPQAIAEILAKAQKTVDRVSIYRNIELFEQLGIVHRIYVGWKYKLELSDMFIAHHHHLSCLGCGKIIDIQDEQHIDAFIRDVADRFSFSARRHQFEIEGYCAACLAASK